MFSLNYTILYQPYVILSFSEQKNKRSLYPAPRAVGLSAIGALLEWRLGGTERIPPVSFYDARVRSEEMSL